MRHRGFSLVETLVAIGIAGLLAAVLTGTTREVLRSSSLAVSANNIRQLAAGAQAYLADNSYTFWKYRAADPKGVLWWWGLEPTASFSKPEGQREFDPLSGPLGGYIPAGLQPDPSFRFGGKAFKPKYKSGYIGIGYNGLLGGGSLGKGTCVSYWSLPKPSEIVVFATSAQINTFQKPATTKNPMLEEFYLIDDKEFTVHFRHRKMAMVAFANGSAGFLPMDISTKDTRAPEAEVGRFAPKGSTKYLLPEEP